MLSQRIPELPKVERSQSKDKPRQGNREHLAVSVSPVFDIAPHGTSEIAMSERSEDRDRDEDRQHLAISIYPVYDIPPGTETIFLHW